MSVDQDVLRRIEECEKELDALQKAPYFEKILAEVPEAEVEYLRHILPRNVIATERDLRFQLVQARVLSPACHYCLRKPSSNGFSDEVSEQELLSKGKLEACTYCHVIFYCGTRCRDLDERAHRARCCRSEAFLDRQEFLPVIHKLDREEYMENIPRNVPIPVEDFAKFKKPRVEEIFD